MVNRRLVLGASIALAACGSALLMGADDPPTLKRVSDDPIELTLPPGTYQSLTFAYSGQKHASVTLGTDRTAPRPRVVVPEGQTVTVPLGSGVAFPEGLTILVLTPYGNYDRTSVFGVKGDGLVVANKLKPKPKK